MKLLRLCITISFTKDEFDNTSQLGDYDPPFCEQYTHVLFRHVPRLPRILDIYSSVVVLGGGGDSTLIRRVCATGVLNLSPCSGEGKPKTYTLVWSYHCFLKSTVLYYIVSYCIVLYCIGDKDHVYALNI